MKSSTLYGSILACVLHGVAPDTYEFHKAAVDKLSDVNDPNYGALDRMVANYAAEAFNAADKRASFEYCLYDNLRKAAQWFPEFNRFTDPVYSVMAREVNMDIEDGNRVKSAAAQQADLDKRAAILNTVLNMAGKGVTSTPALTKMLLGAGAATGAGAGALYWGLNRDSNEDDEKIEAMKERLKHYHRITNEISSDLQRNNATRSQEPQDIIKQDAGTTNVTA